VSVQRVFALTSRSRRQPQPTKCRHDTTANHHGPVRRNGHQPTLVGEVIGVDMAEAKLNVRRHVRVDMFERKIPVHLTVDQVVKLD
jgi:hypothetical protein